MSYVSSITIENPKAFESEGSDVTIISDPIIEYEEMSRKSIPFNWDNMINEAYNHTEQFNDFRNRRFDSEEPAIYAYRCSINADGETVINPIICDNFNKSGDSYVMPEPQLIVLPQLINVTEIVMPKINFFETSSGNSYIMADSPLITLGAPILV